MKKWAPSSMMLVAACFFLLAVAAVVCVEWVCHHTRELNAADVAVQNDRFLGAYADRLRHEFGELDEQISLHDALARSQTLTLSERLADLREALSPSLVTALAYYDDKTHPLATSDPTMAHGVGEAFLRSALVHPDAVLGERVSPVAFMRRPGQATFLLAVVLPLSSEKDTHPEADVVPALLVAEIDARQFLVQSDAEGMPPQTALNVYTAEGTAVRHSDFSAQGKSVAAIYGADSDYVRFFNQAVSREQADATLPLHPAADEEAQDVLVTARAVTLGASRFVLTLQMPRLPLDEPFRIAKRVMILLVLALFVAVMIVGYFWARQRARELGQALARETQKNLERMVEARTLELNFVTRTIKDLIDSIPSALIVLDRNLDVLLVNLSFYTIFGIRRSTVTGCNIADVLPETIRERLRRSLATKAPIRDLEIRRLVEGQGEKVLLLNALHLLGKRDRLLLVIDDISERKVLERQLIQAEKMAGLGTLMSGVAHEINNPLNAIAGMAQIIHARSHEDDTREDAQQIQQFVKRVAEIVRELSRYSRSAKVTDATSSDIHEVIEGALGMVQHSRRLDDVQIEKRFTHDLPLLKLNVNEMEQVFINLLSNAIDALAEAWQKGDREGKRKLLAIHTSLHNGEYVQVEVSDNGCGIPPHHLKSIFDPFFSTKEQGKGTGLGLSICYKIVQRYGGIILVESEEGQRTRFTVRLPINP